VAKASPVLEVAAQADGIGYGELMQQVDEAQEEGDFITAKALLTRLRKKMKEAAARAAQQAREKGQPDVQERPEDPYIVQRLALVTYKSKHPSPKAALEDARELLKTLNPATSNDTETLGLWGAVHKRLWELTEDGAYLDEAIRGYERGFFLRNDYYNGINFAYLLNARADWSTRRALAAQSQAEATQLRAEAVASFVQAQNIRREVLKICERVLASERLSDESRYWVLATIAEAYLGTDDEARAQQAFQEAAAKIPADARQYLKDQPNYKTPASWMTDSTVEQMNKLRGLLANSPLKFVTGA
jgi:hypothetical protein